MSDLLKELSGRGDDMISLCNCDGVLVLCDDLLVRDCRKYIQATLSEREFLEQLAEECMELGHAALKQIRAKKLSPNATPLRRADSIVPFLEEQLDVMSILWLLTGNKMYEHIKNYPKYVRWAKRLGYEIPKKYIWKEAKHE